MRKIFIVLTLFLLGVFVVSASNFNLPTNMVLSCNGLVNLDSDCDGVISSSNLNLTNYYTIAQINAQHSSINSSGNLTILLL